MLRNMLPTEQENKPASRAYVLLVGALVAATVGITTAATWLSFLAFRSLAELVGWDRTTAWAVQPVVELFVLAGAAELALRIWDRREDRWLPEALMYAALVVSVGVNVSAHVLANIAASAPWWHTAVIGVLAVFVPLAQVGGVYLLTDRLRALGDRREFGASSVVPSPDLSAARVDSVRPGQGAYAARPDIPPTQPAKLPTQSANVPANGHGRTAMDRAVAAALALEDGGQLPSRAALARAANVSSGTAGAALARLRTERQSAGPS